MTAFCRLHSPRTLALAAASLMAGLVLAVLAPLPALATDNWSPVRDLSEVGQNANVPKVSLSDDGTRAVAIWLRSDGANDIVQVAAATINGNFATWGSPASLSASGQSASAPQIALSSDGTQAIAVWRQFNGSNWIIRTAAATVSGTTASWGTATNISLTGRDAALPQVALSDDGTRATAVWQRFNGSNWIIQARSASITGSSATWGAVSNISTTGKNAAAAQLALSSNGGTATAVWHNSTDRVVQARSATITGTVASWGTTVNLSSTGSEAWTPQIAGSDDGTSVTAIWYQVDESSWWISQSASGTVSGNTGTWSAPTDLTATGQYAQEQQIALSADGTRATAVWALSNGSQSIIQVASATITGTTATWGSAIDVSAAGQIATEPQIAVSTDGTRAAAIWNRGGVGNAVMQSSAGSVDGTTSTWGAPSDLSDGAGASDDPQIALSTNGTRATALWSRNNGSNTIIQSRSAMMFVPDAPALGFAGDTLTITPPADSGGSPVTEYQILYTTQARIDSGRASGVWATFWPADTLAINFATYQTAAPCTLVAARATPYPGRCARPLGEHTAGKTFIYQVAAINADGRSTYTQLSITR